MKHTPSCTRADGFTVVESADLNKQSEVLIKNNYTHYPGLQDKEHTRLKEFKETKYIWK